MTKSLSGASPNPLDQPHLLRFKALLKELNQESPRGMVLICGSLLDEHLLDSVNARLVDHPAVAKLTLGFNAPLGTFSSRIVAALALGIISTDEFHDLEIVRGIRNDFAHQIVVGFDDPSIKDRCANLLFAAKDYDQIVVGAEGRFSSAAVSLMMRLTNRAHYVGQNRIAIEAWPL